MKAELKVRCEPAPGNVVVVQKFDPVDVERSLEMVGKLWMVSSFYVGSNRPMHVGPLPLHLTLWAIVAPFLLRELNRLRRSVVLPHAERSLRTALAFGVVAYAFGIFWGRVPSVLGLMAILLAVRCFDVAMASLTETHGAADVAAQWRRTGRLTSILAICWAPILVLVLALGNVDWSNWAVGTLVLGGVLSGGAVLLRLASATWRTRSWLEAQAADPHPAE